MLNRPALFTGFAFCLWFAAYGLAYADIRKEFLDVVPFLEGEFGLRGLLALVPALLTVLIARELHERIKARKIKRKLFRYLPALNGGTRTQDVDLSVFAPPLAAPNSEILVQIIIHTLNRAQEAKLRALRIEPKATELASTPLTVPLKRNDKIKVTLDCEGVKVENPTEKVNWNGRLICVYFEMLLQMGATESILTPKVRVFVNGVPAGFVVFKIKVVPDAPTLPLSFAKRVAELPLAEQAGQRYKRAFISYAHEDRVEVLKAAQIMRALHLQYFQDLLSLSPGERWQGRLFQEIERCDIFLLFWSKYARKSAWVIKEAEYALQCSRSDLASHSLEIVPVLLEGPPVPAPPPSLEEIHFNDPIRYIIFAQEMPSFWNSRLWIWSRRLWVSKIGRTVRIMIVSTVLVLIIALILRLFG